MPPENGVGRDDCRDLCQDPTAEALTDGGETPALIVAQPQPLAAQLPFQYAVLFSQELDDIALPVLQPAGQGRDNHMQGKHAPSLR